MQVIDTLDISSDSYKSTDKVEEKLVKIISTLGNDNIIGDSLHHHFSSGGSRVRSRFTYNFCKSFLIDDQDSIILSCIPELLHNASLIHDDLQDQDPDRRDDLSVWKKYSPEIAICSGDFLISATYGTVSELKRKNRVSVLLEHIHGMVADVIKGQVEDLSQTTAQTLDSIKTYEDISAYKSGPLLAMTLTLPLLYTNRGIFVSNAQRVFLHYATAYQILDDILDIERDQSKVGVNSGVNIVTIFQRMGVHTPLRSAEVLASSHLDKAYNSLNDIPFPSNEILRKEIDIMRNKIRKATSH